MSILLLFQQRGYLTLSDIVDALSKGITHSISDKWSLFKHVHGALLSLTAARHALLTSSKVDLAHGPHTIPLPLFICLVCAHVCVGLLPLATTPLLASGSTAPQRVLFGPLGRLRLPALRRGHGVWGQRGFQLPHTSGAAAPRNLERIGGGERQ